MYKIRFVIPFLFLCFIGFSQQLSDFSGVNFADLDDAQIELLMRRATAQGYSQSDLLQLAKKQGLSASQLSGLTKRFSSSAVTSRVSKGNSSPVEDSRLRKAYKDSLTVYREKKSDIFGYSLFQGNQFLSFQSNMNMPTPNDYVLGPGDKLYVDVYGESEQYYELEITPEGTVLIENVGPISLSGLTVTEAKKRIQSRLSTIYSGFANQRTFTSLSVATPRTIRVNIIGEVQLPGTYNFSAFNTAYNALYVAGGLTEKATLRDIKVYRNNKLVAVVDAYPYILKGDSSANIRLQNDDLIVVGTYTNRITISGAVKTPGIFEVKPNESFQDIIKYAGGFKENASTAAVKVSRISNGERMVVDVYESQFPIFEPKAGDEYTVNEVLNRYANRIMVKGAVYRPGTYALTKGLTVSGVLENAEGLVPDALTTRGFIIRTHTDLSTETIPFNVGAILSGSAADIALEREDVVTILSKSELTEDQYVSVSGAINSPGVFSFSTQLTLADVVLMAGGFTEDATGNRIEITRRTDASDSGILSEVLVYDLPLDVAQITTENNPVLYPFDQIRVRTDPNFHMQEFIRVEGQITYPGEYALTTQSERISDVIKRAGGVKDIAYLKGASLIRKTEFAPVVTKIDKKKDELNALKAQLLGSGSLTETNQQLINRIDTDLEQLNQVDETINTETSFAKTQRIKELVERNNLVTDVPLQQSEAIGIDLEAILKAPGSNSDLLLQEGDVVLIPKKQETVRLRGELLYPTTVRYEKGKSLKHFINKAGGFDTKAKRNSTYVIYANGDVARTKQFLFFKFYPKVAPGAEVIVPVKPLKIPVNVNQVIGITSGLATLILAITQIK